MGVTTATRALGALTGLAIGDALGMPTQSLPRELIVARYGEIVTGFHTAPPDHPLAAGLAAGTITDDTEQALLLARLLIDGGGRIDPTELGRRLMLWENDMRARGSLDLLGPSTREAINNLLAGQDPSETGRRGTTNGAAMRIAPVGIAVDITDLDALVDRVTHASSLSHNTGLALAGASAVAAAVSAGIAGATVAEAVPIAVAAARIAGHRGHWVAGGDVAARIEWAVDFVAGTAPNELMRRIYEVVGTSLASQESVPAAFAIFAAHGDRPLAGLPYRGVGGRRHRHDRRDGRSHVRCGAGIFGVPGLCGPSGDQREPPSPDAARQRPSGPAMKPRFERLVHVGNVVVDLVMTVADLPSRGGDMLAGHTTTVAGGGFNVIAAAARQGLAVTYAGRHGTGPFGEIVRTALRSEGVTVTAPATPGPGHRCGGDARRRGRRTDVHHVARSRNHLGLHRCGRHHGDRS